MKNYIRTCLSLDEKTKKQITEISEVSGKSNSEVVKEAIAYFYRHVKAILKDDKN